MQKVAGDRLDFVPAGRQSRTRWLN